MWPGFQASRQELYRGLYEAGRYKSAKLSRSSELPVWSRPSSSASSDSLASSRPRHSKGRQAQMALYLDPD